MERKEWLESRRKYIGASDAPTLMGVSPWRTPYQLWEEKVGLAPFSEPNKAQAYGLATEDEALNAFKVMTGFDVSKPEEPVYYRHPELKFIAANLDGISDDGTVMVEIKCPGETDHETAKNGIVPEKYYAQLQHQLMVTGLQKMYYFSYRKGEGIVIEVERDNPYIKGLLVIEKKFWKHVENLSPPPMTDKDYRVHDEREWFQNVKIAKEADESIRYWESVKEEAKNNLVAMANNHNSKGAGARLTKFFRKGTVDYKSIPELKDIDLDQYRKPSKEYWTLAFDKENDNAATGTLE